MAAQSEEKRKPGTRAGLTKNKIVLAAFNTVATSGADGLSIRSLANQLEVAPGSIHAHFPGGHAELTKAIAGEVLSEIAVPYKPQQSPESYLGELFFRALNGLKAKPGVARLVVSELARDPYVLDLFAERVLATAVAFGLNGEELVWGFYLVLGRLNDVLMLESSPIATSTPSSARKQIEAAIAPLPTSEYPNLNEHVDLLADDPLKRGSEGYLGVVSMRYSNSVIALLKSVTK